MKYHPLKQAKVAKLMLLGLVVLALIFGRMHLMQWQKKRQIAKEIEILTQQQLSLEQKNKELSESLAFLTSGNYKERVARQQMNLKKDGEIVYNFTEAAAPAQKDDAEQNSTAGSRIKSWWLYFFKT